MLSKSETAASTFPRRIHCACSASSIVSTAKVPTPTVRIDSNTLDTLPNVAFKTPDGKEALIVSNPGDAPQNFAVRYKGKAFSTSLGAGAVGTYVW
jgi:glucosylceramidase